MQAAGLNNVAELDNPDINLPKQSNETEQSSHQPQTIELTQPQMSKNQLKKIKKGLKFAEQKEVRKQMRKEKRKQSKEKKRELLESGAEPPKKKGRHPPKDQTMSPLQIVLDCQFENMMTHNEINSTCIQIQRCYSVNRHSTVKSKLHVTSMNGKTLEQFKKIITHSENWKDISFHADSFLQVPDLDKNKMVYLSADSTNVLQELDEEKIYIVGGIVDKNRYKSLCLDVAKSAGISHARLPIAEHVDMKTRSVLTINHVVEIMVKYLECKSWPEALEIIPKRKDRKIKSKDQDEEDDDQEQVDLGEEPNSQ